MALTDSNKVKTDGNWVSFNEWTGSRYLVAELSMAKDSKLGVLVAKNIASNSLFKQFHVNVLSCKNLEFQRFTISAPPESIKTDGIHISRSQNITITNSNIGTGDDCVSIGQGSQHITISNVKCGPGHGISIGSLDNGVRIKTWPASFEDSVKEVIYVMNNVINPVVIDKFTVQLMSVMQSSGIPCKGVEVADIDLTYTGKEASAALSECSHVHPKISGKHSLPICGVSA
ncbi:hypothetical protein Ddye_014265 [Dipteronia dyeriana]|uniref:Polygalacturonase n=1 Tax=Dipteronia dyeriana TaxID=168575 RepID=A0AAD9X7T2_9ROSI|nr:hypothetical protein Ddye_014265 [Dipteronia dyeriana]